MIDAIFVVVFNKITTYIIERHERELREKQKEQKELMDPESTYM